MSTDPVKEPGAAPPRRGDRGKGKVDRRLETKTLAALALAALLVAFAVVNSQKVQIDFLVASTDAPLVIALVIATLLGFVFGVLITRRSRRPQRDPRP